LKNSERRLRRLLFAGLTLIVVAGSGAYLIWELRPLILPVALGVLLAYLFRPLKSAFKYSWLPNGLRVVFLFAVFTASILVGIKFVKDNIPSEKEKLEIVVRFKYKFNEKFDSITGLNHTTGKGNVVYNLIAQDINPLRVSLDQYLELSPEQKEAFVSYSQSEIDPIPDKYYRYFLADQKNHDFQTALKKTAGTLEKVAASEKLPAAQESFLKTVVDVLSIWFLLPIVFVFFLLDEGAIAQFFLKLIPNRYFELALTIKEEVDEAIGKYLRGISLECGLVGISLAAGLFAVGVPFKMAFLIGVLSGVATAVPFLGPIVGLGFGLAYALIAEDIHPILPFMTVESIPIAVVVVNVLVMALDNFVFQPFVLGGAVDLHPLVIILGLMGASMLFGVAGVLLGIPAIVVLKVIVQDTFRGLKDYRII
jgi:predicted PurR-regulated permease PerM